MSITNEIVHEKNKEITDSINYALRIQQAILPPKEDFGKQWSSAFVFFQPKDIVSGDFYWMAERDNLHYYCVADCTGHGVPGAFMSMIGNSLLNQIVSAENLLDPAEILNQLREGIIQSLKQTGDIGAQKDGMDIALICWNPSTKKVQFVGANNSIYVLRKSDQPFIVDQSNISEKSSTDKAKLYEISADKMPVGFQSENAQSFTLRTFEVVEGDRIILFTDGMPDQFGGPKGKKLKYNLFRQFFLERCNLPLKDFENELALFLGNWISEKNHLNERIQQVDDVCIAGFEV